MSELLNILREEAWVLLTLLACLLQTARNALHNILGGTHPGFSGVIVRFVYALPFALLFWLATVVFARQIAWPTAEFWAWALAAAGLQAAAAYTLIWAMRRRSFPVAIALTKT